MGVTYDHEDTNGPISIVTKFFDIDMAGGQADEDDGEDEETCDIYTC